MTTRRRKKHCPEEVVAKLRDADAMLNAGKDLAAVLQALETIEALEACLCEFLPEGFETDDGGQGTLTLDIPTGRLSLHHQENCTATSESSRVWHV